MLQHDQASGAAQRCCEVLTDDRYSSIGDRQPCTATVMTHPGGCQAVAMAERHRSSERPEHVAIIVAGNSGRPGGSCRDIDGSPRLVNGTHRTQEEDVVAGWLACIPDGAERRDAFARINNAWGLPNASGNATMTLQGIDYTASGASPRQYADAWVLGSSRHPVVVSTKKDPSELEGWSVQADDKLPCTLIFCGAPNTEDPDLSPGGARAPSSTIRRTFCAAAAADRDFFECGRAWAVHAALVGARDAGAEVVVLPYVGGGLRAGAFANANDLEARFERSVNEMLHPALGERMARLPDGRPVDALGTHFRCAVYIVKGQ